MKSDIGRIIQLYRLAGFDSIFYVASGIGVSFRNFIITFLTSFLGGNILSLCVSGDFTGLADSLTKFAFLLILFLCFDMTFMFINEHILNRIRMKLRRTCFARILYAPMKQLNELTHNTDLISRINLDIESAVGAFRAMLLPLMFMISGIGATVVILPISWEYIAVLYITGIVMLCTKNFVAKAIRLLSAKMQESRSYMQSSILRFYTWMKELRAASLVSYNDNLFTAQCNTYCSCAKRLAIAEGFLGLLGGIDTIVGCIGILFVSIVFNKTHDITLDNMVFVYTLSPLVIQMFSTLSSSIVSFHKSLVGIDRIWGILNLNNEYENDSDLKKVQIGEDEWSIANLSCSFRDGQVLHFDDTVFPTKGLVALCGASGVGKTSLLRLIVKLYPLSHGTIKIFGQDISSLSVESIRDAITYVPQENIIQNGTVREILGFGGSKESEKKMNEILDFVCAGSWIKELPDGLDTYIGEKNAGISVGQRQSIALAQALLRNTKCYLLDEVFAGIDQKRINLILNNLKDKYPDRLFLIITHDRLVSDMCDSVIWMNNTA